LSIDEVYSSVRLSQGGRRCVDIQLLVATITGVARNWRLASINQGTDGCRLTRVVGRWYLILTRNGHNLDTAILTDHIQRV